jgi:hypothetical protein
MAASNLIELQLPTPHRPNVKRAAQKVFVEQFINSGIPQQAFCELHNLNKSTFKNWVFRHKSSPNPQTPHPSFLPINIIDADEKENDDVGYDDIRPANFFKPNVNVNTEPNVVASANVSAAPSTIPLIHNCDHRLTIFCAQLSIGVPVGFDTKYLRQVLAMVVDL